MLLKTDPVFSIWWVTHQTMKEMRAVLQMPVGTILNIS